MTCRAAYKGFADSIRLLLFLDAYRGRQDKEGTVFYIFICLNYLVTASYEEQVRMYLILLTHHFSS